MSRNTLANANKQRNWRIYAEVAQALIRIARPMYAEEDLGLDLDNTVFALDASTIDLCLSVFPWAPFRSTKAAVLCPPWEGRGAFGPTRNSEAAEKRGTTSLTLR